MLNQPMSSPMMKMMFGCFVLAASAALGMNANVKTRKMEKSFSAMFFTPPISFARLRIGCALTIRLCTCNPTVRCRKNCRELQDSARLDVKPKSNVRVGAQHTNRSVRHQPYCLMSSDRQTHFRGLKCICSPVCHSLLEIVCF